MTQFCIRHRSHWKFWFDRLKFEYRWIMRQKGVHPVWQPWLLWCFVIELNDSFGVSNSVQCMLCSFWNRFNYRLRNQNCYFRNDVDLRHIYVTFLMLCSDAFWCFWSHSLNSASPYKNYFIFSHAGNWKSQQKMFCCIACVPMKHHTGGVCRVDLAQKSRSFELELFEDDAMCTALPRHVAIVADWMASNVIRISRHQAICFLSMWYYDAE
jgi:hypothetical protein